MAQDPILTALDARIAALQDVRARVVAALGLGGPLVPGETLAPARETKGPRRSSKRVVRASTAPKGDTARPTDALLEAKVRAALKQGPLKAKVLAQETGLPAWKVRDLLKSMVAAGTITVSGATASTRYALA